MSDATKNQIRQEIDCHLPIQLSTLYFNTSYKFKLTKYYLGIAVTKFKITFSLKKKYCSFMMHDFL